MNMTSTLEFHDGSLKTPITHVVYNKTKYTIKEFNEMLIKRLILNFLLQRQCRK